jgi:hypothetical protein
LISVYDAGGDDDQHRPILANHFRDVSAVGRRGRPVVPQKNLEIGWAEETKAIGLVEVLVGTARDAGLAFGDIGHYRMKLGRQIVVTEQLA